jgi:hypothetical protein
MMVHIGRAYLTEKQMPRTFRFNATTHAVCMMNAIHGTYLGCLVSPFLLIHGIGHDERTWIPIFSLCYFHHKRGSNLLNVSSTTEPIRRRIGSVVELTFNKSAIPRVRTVGPAILALF